MPGNTKSAFCHAVLQYSRLILCRAVAALHTQYGRSQRSAIQVGRACKGKGLYCVGGSARAGGTVLTRGAGTRTVYCAVLYGYGAARSAALCAVLMLYAVPHAVEYNIILIASYEHALLQHKVQRHCSHNLAKALLILHQRQALQYTAGFV